MSPVMRVLVQDDEVLEHLTHLVDVAHEHDEAARVAGDEPPDAVHRALEVLGVEAAEPLVEEEGVEPPAAARHHLGQGEREREGGEERLAAREAVGPPLRSLPAFMSTTSNRSSSVNR